MVDLPCKVYECGSGKWVRVDNSEVKFTSSSHEATTFTMSELISANGWFEEFLAYRPTMLAVPLGSNQRPYNCSTVTEFIRQWKENNAENYDETA